MLLITGCAPSAPPVKRVVLLAPFEGVYREIGYDALYPVRLALKDTSVSDIQLLSLDDGSSVQSATARAKSLAADPTVMLALVAGGYATAPDVLAAFGDVPVIVIGHWNAIPDGNTFVLASADLTERLTSNETDVYAAAGIPEGTGGETFGLKAFPLLAGDTSDITVVTSAAPSSPEFNARLVESDLFVPQPGLLATLAYDAGTLAARVLSSTATRADVLAALRDGQIESINGAIRFDTEGYLANAAIYEYRYENGALVMRLP